MCIDAMMSLRHKIVQLYLLWVWHTGYLQLVKRLSVTVSHYQFGVPVLCDVNEVTSYHGHVQAYSPLEVMHTGGVVSSAIVVYAGDTDVTNSEQDTVGLWWIVCMILHCVVSLQHRGRC